MIGGIDHVAITMPAGSEAAAVQFFHGVLGLAVLEKPATLAGRGGAWFSLGAQQLHLQAESCHVPAKRAHPAFACSDLDAAAEALQGNGRPLKWDDELAPRRRFYSEDPFGNRLEFIEPQ